MPRFRHAATGVVANFPEGEAAKLTASEWQPVVVTPPPVAQAPTRRRTPPVK
jgi:hypothetical protein